jgi:anti-sigma-K factor RskA
MTDPLDSPEDRIQELLADRAVFGLTADEQAELDALLAAHPFADPEALDRLAADLARATVPTVPEPMPVRLLAKVLADAPSHLPTVTPRPTKTRTGKLRYLVAGLTVAACLMLAVGWWRWNQSGPAPSPADRRNEMLARINLPGNDVIRLEWTATADPAAKGASGEVVWSSETQEGYMLFRGLASNSPTREQYQLWVFDASRDERYPVDGGVFDIPEGAGEVVVPIRVKLGVSRPTLFAVTVEPPGGVVVSSRERLPLLAKVKAG